MAAEPTLLGAGGWVRLDALGGVAGDMFAAAAVDAWPELGPRIASGLEALGLPFRLDAVWSRVTRRGIGACHASFSTEAGGGHPTGAVAEVRRLLLASGLSDAEKRHATGILGAIADAEAQVHGKPPEDIHLHELADWDSIADVVAAAVVIAAVGDTQWVCPTLPLGGGRVDCAHGPLPVPAPATAILCRGATFVDDGVGGERVTPTGAAILSYLGALAARRTPPGRLVATGYGAGSRDMSRVPNVLRMLFMHPETEGPALHDEIAVLRFDIDDQSPEDLAIGLDRIRALVGVLSVINLPALGKRGRQVGSIEVLAEPACVDAVVAACFAETTTLGVRMRMESRRVLRREEVKVNGGTEGVAPVKRAFRADGAVSAKVEARFLEASDVDRLGREALRRTFESAALDAPPARGAPSEESP
jgi:uncharacterized protein (TIGR00299 family) protein